MSSSPIIRVCRKRSADPHSALVLSLKRHKADPLFFSLFKTSSDSLSIAAAQPDRPIIDFCPSPTAPVPQVPLDEADVANPLAFANEVVGEVGGAEPPPPKEDNDVIMVNGRPLVPASPIVRDEFVFDFYRIAGGALPIGDKAEMDTMSPEEWEMRFATKDEELIYGNDDSESETGCVDDDEDSNDEDNWRNEYPEDDEEGDESGQDDRESLDGYVMGGGSRDSDGDDGLRLRMQRFGIGEEEYGSQDEDEADEDE